MRLIDADDLAAKIMMDAPDFMDGGSSITKAFILAMVKTRSITPTVNAVPVVQCKDCENAEILPWLDNVIICKKHSYTGVRPDEFYCADGKKRGSGNDRQS